MNLSLYTVDAFVIMDSDGHRVLAKYYQPAGHPESAKGLQTLKEQRAFEKGLYAKTKKPGGAPGIFACVTPGAHLSLETRTNHVGDIILYDGHLAVYKHTLDLIFYVIGGASENELMLQSALLAFHDALSMLLRNQVEKRGVLESLDMVLLCLDETIDDGCVGRMAGVARVLVLMVRSGSSSRRTRPRLPLA
jgi:coatomer subunit zeta